MSIQDIKNSLTKLKGLIAEDKGDEAAGLLSGIEREVTDVFADRHTANEESKGRKEKIRELESAAEEQADKYQKLQESKSGDDETYNTLKTENEKLKAVVSKQQEADRGKLSNWYDKHNEKPGFEKIKDLLKYPEKTDDKFDWSKLSEADLLANQNEIARAENYGIFEKEPTTPPGKVPGGVPPAKPAGKFQDSQFNTG